MKCEILFDEINLCLRRIYDCYFSKNLYGAHSKWVFLMWEFQQSKRGTRKRITCYKYCRRPWNQPDNMHRYKYKDIRLKEIEAAYFVWNSEAVATIFCCLQEKICIWLYTFITIIHFILKYVLVNTIGNQKQRNSNESPNENLIYFYF